MKLTDVFSLCAILRELLARSRKSIQLLTTIAKTQEQIMSKADEIKAIQEQDIQEQRETAAAGQAAVQRLTDKVTTLADTITSLQQQIAEGTISAADVADLKAKSDEAKAVADEVQAAFDQAGG